MKSFQTVARSQGRLMEAVREKLCKPADMLADCRSTHLFASVKDSATFDGTALITGMDIGFLKRASL